MRRLNSRPWAAVALTVSMLASGSARAVDAALTVTLDNLDASGRFADHSTFCPPGGGVKDVSPGVSWSKAPPGTRSYALLMSDSDVPANFTLINKPGVVLPEKTPRIRVFHWVLADIPSAVQTLPPGVEGEGLVPGGKPIGPTPHGLRGANVFTTFLAEVKGMGGTYGGYDGPCPPTNDRRPHRYTVRIFALDVVTLGLSGAFTGDTVERAITGHILAKGEVVGTYSLYSER